jgi:acetylornithine/succinyldiaminopimelate/putrescine aminotransferase
MSQAADWFRRHVAQTSDAPIGLEIERAEGSWLYAADGRRYLDFIAGIGVSALGHRHPAVLAAIERQMRRHLHVMVYGEYVIETQARLARRLAELLPPPLGRVYFANSGAEGIEGALKAARKFTGRRALVAFDGAYHGDTQAALGLSGNPAFREPFGPFAGPITHLPYGERAALEAIDDTVAAVVIEPIQAEGGVRVPSVEFMHALRRRCDQSGALLVFDEVLTGLGRTGRLFALEHFGVVPDVIVLAKALGGGLPLGAFAARDEIHAVLAHEPPLGHITTFGGNPLACAAGLATLEVITGERLFERATVLGNELLRRFRAYQGDWVADTRGVGLLVGIEFREAAMARKFTAATIARGVVVNWTLNADRVVRLAPPLTLCEDELEFAMRAMDEALETLEHGAESDG